MLLEQHAVQFVLILVENRAQIGSDSENYVEIPAIDEVLFLPVYPVFLREGLALGAMAVSAGVV